MALKFTKQQQEAIDTRGKSILVSAAAGSGKTAVLVERILKIILDEGVNVDEMLVVTFTRAAAAEMRVRLAKAIRKRMADCPEQAPRLRDQLNRLYRANISTIDSFALNVVREFFYMIDIEPDFNACDAVLSEIFQRDAMDELFEEAFENDNLIPGCSFRAFLRLYSEERDEEAIKAQLLKSYSALRAMPRYFDWAIESAGNLKVGLEHLEDSILWKYIAEDAIAVLGLACEGVEQVRRICLERDVPLMFDDKFSEEYDEFNRLYYIANDRGFGVEELRCMGNIKLPQLRWKFSYLGLSSSADSEEKEASKEYYESFKDELSLARDTYRKELERVRNEYVTPSLEALIDETNATYEYTIYYIRLLQEFERRYDAKKMERRVMDFGDMEHYAVRILDNDIASDTLRKRFKYVFVDEYQDTNNLQEYLISKVSRGDNVFKVGDLKQSIYKFRQAEPEIFEKLYADYSREEITDGTVIDLSRNYRSNDATIQYINKVFTSIMPGYDERARLYTGLEIPSEFDFIPEFHILHDDGKINSASVDNKEDLESLDSQSQGDEQSENSETDLTTGVDEEIQDITKEEAEARYIANLAKEIIGTSFYDSKAGVIRTAGPSDITILLRSVKVRGQIYSKALRNLGIESQLAVREDYFDTVEISIALSLLQCIDNMKRDIPLIGTLHSEAFSWSPEELARVRIAHNEHVAALRAEGVEDLANRRAPYWEALSWYIDEGQDPMLREKSTYARDTILKWRRMSRMMPLDDFVWQILTDSGYYKMVGAMNNGALRQANLRILADRAAQYSKDTVASLSSFTGFLDAMRKKGINNGQASMDASEEGAVTISTIHKSKGLEYPFVIVGGLGARLRGKADTGTFDMDPAIGVGISYVSPSRRYMRRSILQKAIRAKYEYADYQEQLRILYVAMTRARNKLILVGSCKNLDFLTKFNQRKSTFLEVLSSVVATPYNQYYIRQLDRQEHPSDMPRAKKVLASLPSMMNAEVQELYDMLDARFRYEYPYIEDLTAKAKYSVSDLRHAAISQAKASQSSSEGTPRGPSSEISKTRAVEIIAEGGAPMDAEDLGSIGRFQAMRHRANAMDIGTAYHRLMECLDFGRVITESGAVDLGYIKEKAAMLAANGAIEDCIYKKLDYSKISKFFETSLGRRASAAATLGTLRKEKSFTLRTEHRGKSILVQGIIDCCFPENGKMILVDYKTSYISPDRNHEREIARIKDEYRVQVELYSEALVKGTGIEVGEAYLYLFETGEAVIM